MRKLSLLVVALAFFVGTTANAATEPNESNPVTITQEIGKFLANPDFDFGRDRQGFFYDQQRQRGGCAVCRLRQ